jgi:type II secretory pathway pseudopilin PulG
MRRDLISLRETPAGVTLLELLFVVAVGATAMALAVPLIADTVDERRAAFAARYIAARIMTARIDAVRRATCIGLRFEPASGDYVFAAFGDGNDNGVRSADISTGVDRPLSAYERLSDKFPGVRFALLADAVDADGRASGDPDGLRIGTARILTMSPDGTATSGTLYVQSRRSQYAVRGLGVTGRTRVLQYLPGDRTWVSR